MFRSIVMLYLMLVCAHAWCALPLMVGGHAHGAQNIQVLANLGLGNFVWIPKLGYSMGNTPWNEEHNIFADVDACVRHNMRFMISERRGLGAAVQPGGGEYGGDCSGDIHSEETVRAIAAKAGNLFVGLHAEEMDADFLQSAIRPSFMTRVPELYDFTDRAGGRRNFEGELLRLKNLYHSWGAAFIPNMCVTGHISGFRTGADIVIAEPLEHCATTELQLAYLRGGAQQFGGDWGVWVSPWYRGEVPCEDKTLWPASQAVIGGGHLASEFKRALYLSFVSGARLLTVQETEPLFSSDGAGGYKLAAWGRELKNFWEYARRHDAPFRPVVPTALLIDKDNGWSPPHLWGGWIPEQRVWGHLPIERGDRMLCGFLNLFLPGFDSRREAGPEHKDSYPGFFAATPLGPFDVVASDISPEKLATYPLVIALGDIEMTPELLSTLKSYVKGGGTLVINLLQMRNRKALVQDEEFLGARLGNPSREWTRLYWSSEIICTPDLTFIPDRKFSEPWFCAIETHPTTAEVLATESSGQPVLIRNKFGAGYVYLTTPEYMMDGQVNGSTVLGFARALLKAMVSKSPTWVEAEDVSWLASRQGSDTVVIVANHSATSRTATITWQGTFRKVALDVGGGEIKTEKRNDGTAFILDVPPEDLIILRISA